MSVNNERHHQDRNLHSMAAQAIEYKGVGSALMHCYKRCGVGSNIRLGDAAQPMTDIAPMLHDGSGLRTTRGMDVEGRLEQM